MRWPHPCCHLKGWLGVAKKLNYFIYLSVKQATLACREEALATSHASPRTLKLAFLSQKEADHRVSARTPGKNRGSKKPNRRRTLRRRPKVAPVAWPSTLAPLSKAVKPLGRDGKVGRPFPSILLCQNQSISAIFVPGRNKDFDSFKALSESGFSLGQGNLRLPGPWALARASPSGSLRACWTRTPQR